MNPRSTVLCPACHTPQQVNAKTCYRCGMALQTDFGAPGMNESTYSPIEPAPWWYQEVGEVAPSEVPPSNEWTGVAPRMSVSERETTDPLSTNPPATPPPPPPPPGAFSGGWPPVQPPQMGSKSKGPLIVGAAVLGIVLLLLPVLALFFLGHTSTTGSYRQTPSALQHELAESDIGRRVTPNLGRDGIPVSLHAPAPGSGQVVSQADAGKIIADTWNLRLEAIYANKMGLLAKFETGVQLAADQHNCGCDPPPGTAIHSWAASALSQTTYPETFIGQITIHIAGEDEFQLLAFRRASADQPWKLDALVGSVITPTFGPPLSSARNLQGLVEDQNQVVVRAPLAAEEAAAMNEYWNYWVQNGSEDPSSYLSAGYGALTDRGKANVEEIQTARAAGVNLVYQYSDDSPPDGPEIFPDTTILGSAIVCGGTTYTSTYTPMNPNATFRQTSGETAIVDPTVLAAGNYRRVVVHGYRPWCEITDTDHRVFASIGFTGKYVTEATH